MKPRAPLPETFRRAIAHRGRHRAAAPLIVENTAAAFEAAISAGLGIECDVRAAKDGLPVIHHDPDLNGHGAAWGGRRISDLDADAVAATCDAQGNRLLTLRAGLERVGGRTPLLIELKFDRRAPADGFLDQIADELSRYAGAAAVMSFEAAPLQSLAQMIPETPRGIVAENRFSQLEQFEAIGASFVAYRVDDLPNPEVAALRRNSATVFAWTVRDKAQLHIARRSADAPICEGPAADLLANDARTAPRA